MTAGVRLLRAGDIRDIAGRLGVRPTKRLGQNFVVEQGTVRRIAALAAPRDGDVVLEVGPGLGSLTLALLEAAAGSDARLVAVEIDPAMAAALPATVAERAPEAAGRFCAVRADALHVAGPGGALGGATEGGQASGEPTGRRARGSGVELPWAPTVLAANLPYN